MDLDEEIPAEPLYGVSYDPLEHPNVATTARDLEDRLMERALRFFDEKLVVKKEKCYLVGLEDKSVEGEEVDYTLEESLTELSELAGAAGLTVVGSTYQRLQQPSVEYYIGPGKLKDIGKELAKLKCFCVVFDTELSPSQQKNLELSFNQDNDRRAKYPIKVVDRTALILDIFAQHARSREGQLQVQLALLSYRLPRLTNMWSHLERQAAGARGKSNGGVGLRGPGEKQLESDRRQMKSKIAALNRAIDTVRSHRAVRRGRRRLLGAPVVALVGYTNAGKSSTLNALASISADKPKGEVFAADILFATLDPTTRRISVPGMAHPDMLLTDTVGFIQKLPSNLVAAFRATLEEISEADVLLHVTDVSNPSWRKQQAAVLKELSSMGLADKPVVTFWNKVDMLPKQKEFLKAEAAKRVSTVCGSAHTGEGMRDVVRALETALASRMEPVNVLIPHEALACTSAGDFGVESGGTLLNTIHRLGSLSAVSVTEQGTQI
eukprot:gene3378-4188_t